MTIFEISKTKQVTVKSRTQELPQQEGAEDELGASCLNSGHGTHEFNMPFVSQSFPAEEAGPIQYFSGHLNDLFLSLS